jgi:hypothetical protein
MTEEQYKFLNTLRNSFNHLVWQTPVLSLTAQAFLFRIILSDICPIYNRLIAAGLAMAAALASIHLISKHRFYATQQAIMLNNFENYKNIFPANCKSVPTKKPLRWSSFIIWRYLL